MNILFVMAAVAALEPITVPAPGITDPRPDVMCLPAITIVGEYPEHHTLVLRLTNGAPVPASFSGYGPEAPLYFVEEWNGTAWALPDGFRGVCGTGLEARWMKPFSSLEFEVPIQPGHRITFTMTMQGSPDPVTVVSPPLVP